MAKDVKRLPASVQKRYAPLLLGAGILLAATMGLQHNIDPFVAEIHKREGGISQVSGGLNNEFMLLPLLGFREAAAGLLWVRLGNCRRAFLVRVFKEQWPRVLERFQSGERFVELR